MVGDKTPLRQVENLNFVIQTRNNVGAINAVSVPPFKTQKTLAKFFLHKRFLEKKGWSQTNAYNVESALGVRFRTRHRVFFVHGDGDQVMIFARRDFHLDEITGFKRLERFHKALPVDIRRITLGTRNG